MYFYKIAQGIHSSIATIIKYLKLYSYDVYLYIKLVIKSTLMTLVSQVALYLN